MIIVQGVVGHNGEIDQVEVDGLPDTVKQISEGVFEIIDKELPSGNPYDFSDIPLPHEIGQTASIPFSDDNTPTPTLNDLMGDYSEPFERTNWDEETLLFIVKPLKLKQIKAIARSVRELSKTENEEMSAAESTIDQLCTMAVNIIRVVVLDSTDSHAATRRATLEEIEDYFEATELNSLIMQYIGTKLTAGSNGLPNL